MSALVTEAHLELAKTVIFSRDSAGRLLTAPMGAQLIADSEAKAAEELLALVGTIRSQLNLIPRNVGDITPAEHRHETGAAIDQLRAEVERLKRDYDYDHKCLHEVRERCELWKQRAERAEAEVADLKANNRFHRGHSAGYAEAKADCEAELAAERARLDWLEDNAGDIPRYHSRSWIWIAHQNLRFAIDAAMKEGSA